MSCVRKTRGRQKIEMKKMTNESNLQVTFSKRRSGLFKKASELCTLCGANVALVVFSPGEKVFSFGHPNVETVINRYLTRDIPENNGTMQLIEANRSAIVRELNAQLTQVTSQLENDKKHNEQLNRICKEIQTQFWWASPIVKMNRPQLELIKEALEELKKDIARQVNMQIIQGASGASSIATPFFDGSTHSSGISLHQPTPTPPSLAQLFTPLGFFQNPMMQGHLYDGMMSNQGYNIGGYGYF